MCALATSADAAAVDVDARQGEGQRGAGDGMNGWLAKGEMPRAKT